MSKGILHVRILEGRNVKDADIITGKGDPFVEFWLDKWRKQRTESRFNTRTPVWLEERTFIVNGHKHLHLRLIDKDLIIDDKLGETKIPLETVYKHFFQDLWVHVSPPGKHESTGEIHVVMEFFPDGSQ
ncbi:3218_t:CDS:2 [Ambispora leptoticha]|uniref:3218_t:CDS:1 n=1 Tax=Ambispora leptoticha TaxID=144679 RepID=A0A9N9CFK5_9GLOM|nr:3218_t:CDS:2 [Ambispora leptoticha]